MNIMDFLLFTCIMCLFVGIATYAYDKLQKQKYKREEPQLVVSIELPDDVEIIGTYEETTDA
ncbi:MAG: hypothetical protein ACXAEN_27210 [Candidatus Thorarchaeota archaeon]|jgi:hypothetical protein